MKPPATIVIGEVVRLREKLSWFEKLPLFGQRIVVTRTREQAGTMSALLREQGAEVIELPTIRIEPAADYAPLDRAIENLKEYDWLIFTSVNGVKFFLDRLDKSPVDTRSIRGKICAIGPATRESLERELIEGTRVLLARAAVARDILPRELTNRGARVDVVEAYKTVVPSDLPKHFAEITAARKPDWITFTSSSTAQNLISAVGAAALTGIRTASIGPVTSATLRQNSIDVTVEASVFTVPGLVAGIINR
jgi:uroporphyrinogen III methyltransferase/synthase